MKKIYSDLNFSVTWWRNTESTYFEKRIPDCNIHVFKSMPILHPNGRKLKAAKVVDLTSLMKYVLPIYHDFYQKIIESYEDVVASYKKKKTSKQKSKLTAKESEVESEVEDLR